MTAPEVRAGAEFRVSGRTLSGVVMPYGSISPDFRERFEPGAFGAVDRVDVNLQHDRSIVLARDAVLTDSPRELRVRAELAPGSAALRLVQRGALNGFSVEFHSQEERREAGIRVVARANLAGLALVDAGAYPLAKAEVRARSGRTMRAVIPANTKVACECSGAACKFAEFTGEAMAEMFAEVFEQFEREAVAAFGNYSTPLASVSKGTMRGRTLDNGDGEIEIDIPTGAAGQAVLDAHENAGVVARPFLDASESESSIEQRASSDTRVYRKASMRAIIISASDSREGWPAPELVPTPGMDREAPVRRMRRWL